MKGRRLDARYTLLDKLGAGGQGEVWRAHDDIRGIDIALKVLNPAVSRADAAWDALEHEYAIATRLDHPSILKIFPPDRSGDVIVLPMELASGGDLRRLRGTGFLEIIPVLLEIAQALEHAHERGVVHRDLKPGNVLFDARGRARLADFGVAESAVNGPETPAAAASRDTNRHGFSPFTASPAQLRGEPPTPADDVYGLGALAYELLSGYPPYYPHFDKQRAIEDKVPEIVPTRQIPPLLRALVMRMLEKDPKLRPRTMREVIDELDSALNDTLTFDFESVTPAAKNDALARPARFATQIPAANTTRGQAKGDSEDANGDWSARSGQDRRATSDRRSRPREEETSSRRGPPASPASSAGAAAQRRGSPPASDHSKRRVPPPAVRVAPEPRTAPPSLDDPPAARFDAASERRTDSYRSGSSALARIDAALERAASQTAAMRSGNHVHVPPPVAARSAPPRPAPAAVAEPPAQPPPEPVQPAATAASLDAYPPVDAITVSKHSTKPMRSGAVHPTWNNVPLDGLPRVARLQPIRPSRWPFVFLGLLVGAGAAAFFWLPRINAQNLPPDLAAVVTPVQSAVAAAKLTFGSGTHTAAPASNAPAPAVNETAPAVPGTRAAETTPAADSSSSQDQHLHAMRQQFDQRLALLESRGAAVWGGRNFALAKTRAAESVGARDAGNTRVAQEKLTAAARLLDGVEARAPEAYASQVAAGEEALGTGQQEVAGQAFDFARRIEPGDQRASDGQRRAQSLNGVLPLLADAQNAETARDYARAAQDYSQALALDPNNSIARAGQARANAAFGEDSYAKAVGSGFAALGAGRLDEARASFVKARALKPGGAEAKEGLRRVSGALTARGFSSTRQRAAGLEAQERWGDAEQAYEDVLSADPTLAFAQEGKARTSSRADLAIRLQQIIDRPERLTSAGARMEARGLLETALAQSPSGPVLRSQISRVQILMGAEDRAPMGQDTRALVAGDDRPVHLSLQSDNSTQIAISNIGSFGTFSHRDIELRPGTYIVVGTREGFRDVRREITVAPGQGTQTVRVSCSEPI